MLKFCAGRHESRKGIQKPHRKRKRATEGKNSRYTAIREAKPNGKQRENRPQCPKNAPQRTNGTQGERIHHSRHKTQYSPLYKPYITSPLRIPRQPSELPPVRTAHASRDRSIFAMYMSIFARFVKCSYNPKYLLIELYNMLSMFICGI